MTVAAKPPAIAYLEDGVSLNFPVPFRFLTGSDLKAARILADGTVVDLVYGANYSAIGGETDDGGQLTLVASVAGSTLRIRRETARRQSTDYTTDDRFPAESHEAALDRAMLIDQEQDAKIADTAARALMVPDGETSPTIPAKGVRADRMLGFDGFGNPVASGFTMAQVAQIVAAVFNPVFTQLASLVLYLALGVGAVVRSVQSRFDDDVHVFDYLTLAQQTAVKAGTVTAGLAAAVQAAIDAAAATGARLIVQTGTYLFDPVTAMNWEGVGTYPTYAALRIRSNMHIRGNGAVFKIKNGVSTDGAPKSLALFATDVPLADVSCWDLVMDMNGTNNPISPSRGTLAYNQFNQSHWLVSGTNGGNAARIDSCSLLRNTYRDTPGTNCIVCAQTNTPAMALGKDWTIADSQFLENGGDTDDHTSVYAWCDRATIARNRFANSTPAGTVGKTGGTRCIEVHGDYHHVVDNRFVNYVHGVSVAPNKTGATSRTIIARNHFKTLFYGVSIYLEDTYANMMSDTLIEGNVAEFDDTVFAAVPALNFKAFVNIGGKYAARHITARGNKIVKDGAAVACAGLSLEAANIAANKTSDIIFSDNDGHGLTFGTLVRTNATNGLGVVDVRDNNWNNCTPAGIYAIAAGDAVGPAGAGQIDQLLLGGGSCVDDRGAPQCTYGVTLDGVFGLYHRERSAYLNMATADYLEGTVTVTPANRRGYHPSIPFTPTWRGGATAVTVGNGSVAGLMNIDGRSVTIEVRLTLGSTTVVPATGISFDLPIGALSANVQFLGTARIADVSGPLFKFVAAEIDPGATLAALQVDGGTSVSNATPVALANGDVISAQIQYQRA